MKGLEKLNHDEVYLEIGHTSLRVLNGTDSLELPLERRENGRLTELCREQVTARLRTFLKKPSWQPRQRAWCAIGARGVSLRRLSLPSATTEELRRLLQLQIESEFPLPPDQLAWGYSRMDRQNPAPNQANGRQELLVAAVKKESLAEYAEVLSACGVAPAFTLAALARACLFAQPRGSCAVLNIGRSHSELLSFENGAPSSIRVIPWGGEHITRSIQEKLGITHDEAEQMKLKLDQGPSANGGLGQKIQQAVAAALESLAGALNGNWTRLYITGRSARLKDMAPQIAQRLRNDATCEWVELGAGEGPSAAILGLKKCAEQTGGQPPLLLQLEEAANGQSIAPPMSWKWVARAGGLRFSLRALTSCA